MTRDSGLDAGEAFERYVRELRRVWPPNQELAEKHGVPAGKRDSHTKHMTAQTDSTDAQLYDTMMSRRRMMQVTAGAAALAATGAMPAAAASGLNYGSGLLQNPRLEGTIQIADHDGANEEFGDELDYYNDNGEVVSLADQGGRVAEADDSDTPHNPVALEARNIAHEEYTAFPRGIKYDSDGDGDVDSDDDPVEWHDPTHWTKDASGSAGTGSMTEADGDALQITTSSQTSGDTITWTLDLSTVGDSDATITSGMSRKILQEVVDIDALPSGAVIDFALIDSAGAEVTASIDPGGDTGTAGVLFDATVTSGVAQVDVGDLESEQSVSLDDIQKVEIRVSDENPDITLHAFNVERESRWEYGTEEYTNADDELDTRTLEEPAGEFSITGIDTLDDVFSDATIADLKVDVEFVAELLPGDQEDHAFSDADRYSYARMFEQVLGWDLPSAYDITYTTNLSLTDEVVNPGDRFVETRFVTGVDEIPDLSDDHDLDDDYNWTDESSTYENASIDSTITLSSSVSGGQRVVWHQEVLYSEGEEEDIVAAGGGGGAPMQSSSAGFWGLSQAQAFGGAIVAGVLAWFAGLKDLVVR